MSENSEALPYFAKCKGLYEPSITAANPMIFESHNATFAVARQF
ncbi:hypothetical protein VIC_001186 [Vibrio coralliilyticus ATCC BAA-450]|nr:hypothetical protein VIC_001186 [Vibrio coralliilyticus ATCC BAA-450]